MDYSDGQLEMKLVHSQLISMCSVVKEDEKQVQECGVLQGRLELPIVRT